MLATDGGWRTADADGGQTNDKNKKKLKKYINKYKNENNQLIIEKRKKDVEISPGARRLYVDNKNENY